MKKEEQIQIPKQAFFDAIILLQTFEKYDFSPCLNGYEKKCIERLNEALNAKLDSMVLRDLYTKYKNAKLTAEEREEARKEYLERKGVHKDFQW